MSDWIDRLERRLGLAPMIPEVDPDDTNEGVLEASAVGAAIAAEMLRTPGLPADLIASAQAVVDGDRELRRVLGAEPSGGPA